MSAIHQQQPPAAAHQSAPPGRPLPPAMDVQPTTAGLLQFPSLPKQQLPLITTTYSPTNLLSSCMFKNELKAKQSQFSTTSEDIDERIRQRREAQMTSGRPMQQMPSDRMPEKLLSTAQRERRPFAYSPDANDPNNRGKLDLTQIKSPTMRRRLLANMDSGEKQKIEDEYEPAADESTPPQGCQTVHCERYESFMEAPTRNSGSKQHQVIIQYNGPPTFYNTRQETTQSWADHEWLRQPSKGVARSRNADYLEHLNAEVAESLESLSLLVNDLDRSSPSSRLSSSPHQQAQQLAMNRHQGRHLSTFAPPKQISDSNQSIRSTQPYHSAPSFYSTLPSGRLVGDFLLAPDSNYFAPSSLSGPYSMAPYYGTNLDIDEPVRHNNAVQNKKTASYRTFY